MCCRCSLAKRAVGSVGDCRYIFSQRQRSQNMGPIDPWCGEGSAMWENFEGDSSARRTVDRGKGEGGSRSQLRVEPTRN